MSKGNKTKGNREAKKPKQEKPKATSAGAPARPGLEIGGKKIK